MLSGLCVPEYLGCVRAHRRSGIEPPLRKDQGSFSWMSVRLVRLVNSCSKDDHSMASSAVMAGDVLMALTKSRISNKTLLVRFGGMGNLYFGVGIHSNYRDFFPPQEKISDFL